MNNVNASHTRKELTVLSGVSVVILSYVLAALVSSYFVIIDLIGADAGTFIFRTLLLASVFSIAYFWFGRRLIEIVGINFPAYRYLVFGGVLVLAFFPIDLVAQTGYLERLISQHADSQSLAQLLEKYMVNWQWKQNNFAVLICGAILIGPVGEEICFRGVLQQALKKSRLGQVGAIIVVSIFWTADHYGFSGGVGLIATFLFGCLLGYMREKSRSIAPSVMMHMLINSLWLATWAGKLYQ